MSPGRAARREHLPQPPAGCAAMKQIGRKAPGTGMCRSAGQRARTPAQVFVSSFISQTAVCEPLALLVRLCRTLNNGVFPALSPFPSQFSSCTPGSASHRGQPLTPAAWHRLPATRPANPPPCARPLAASAVTKDAWFPLSNHVKSARLAKNNCRLVQITICKVEEAHKGTNIQLVLASGGSFQPSLNAPALCQVSPVELVKFWRDFVIS